MHITGRVKSENEKGYYIVDVINKAINVGVKISIYYSELNGKKKEVLRNDGKPYTVSPFDLILDGDYYYLTGYCDERESVRTYRVDRIKKQPELLTEKAVKKPKLSYFALNSIHSLSIRTTTLSSSITAYGVPKSLLKLASPSF